MLNIARHVHNRYQIENTSPRDVCLWAGFPSSRCLLSYTSTPDTTGTAVSRVARSNGTDASYDSYSAYSAQHHTYIPEVMEYTGRRYLVHNNISTGADIVSVTWSDLDAEDLPLANEVNACVLLCFMCWCDVLYLLTF